MHCRLLGERKKALQRAIEGLGQHGMVGTSDERLMNLHDALKLEFQKVQRTYQDSLEKLDALALVVGKVGKGQVSGHGKAPIAQSHQRQLSLKADEIQERLIKNKTLLNVVEPTLENTSLEVDSYRLLVLNPTVKDLSYLMCSRCFLEFFSSGLSWTRSACSSTPS